MPILDIIHKHPYPTFIPKGATKLILGSIPPPRFTMEGGELQEGDTDFYYGSCDNDFWPILSELSGLTLETVSEQKQFLTDHHIAISDIVETCTRKNNDSAAENDIKVETFRDLSDVWNHKITDVYCLSVWVYNQFLNNYKYEIPSHVSVYYCPSPSRSYFRRAKDSDFFLEALKKDPGLTPVQFRKNCYRELL